MTGRALNRPFKGSPECISQKSSRTQFRRRIGQSDKARESGWSEIRNFCTCRARARVGAEGRRLEGDQKLKEGRGILDFSNVFKRQKSKE